MSKGKRIFGDRIRNKNFLRLLLILFCLCAIIAAELNIIENCTKENKVKLDNKNFQSFRSMDFLDGSLSNLDYLCKKNKKDFTRSLANIMVEKDFRPKEPINISDFNRAANNKRKDDIYYERYRMVFDDLKYFPIPFEFEDQVNYDNSWGGERTYGGDRIHEGTDLMSKENKRGQIPIISMTDGVVENIGWLKLGGYRIGIRSPSGAYFYYAHMFQYAQGLKQGDTVKAGEFLGFMGDSGYSEVEGTVGNFDVHLHLGIYIKDKTGEDYSINPYYLINYLEN